MGSHLTVKSGVKVYFSAYEKLVNLYYLSNFISLNTRGIKALLFLMYAQISPHEKLVKLYQFLKLF